MKLLSIDTSIIFTTPQPDPFDHDADSDLDDSGDMEWSCQLLLHCVKNNWMDMVKLLLGQGLQSPHIPYEVSECKPIMCTNLTSLLIG